MARDESESGSESSDVEVGVAAELERVMVNAPWKLAVVLLAMSESSEVDAIGELERVDVDLAGELAVVLFVEFETTADEDETGEVVFVFVLEPLDEVPLTKPCLISSSVDTFRPARLTASSTDESAQL